MDDTVHTGIGGIGDWPKRRAFLSGERTAFIEGDRRVSYADFDRRTDQLAQALRETGVRPGDRVGALMVNSVAFLETMFAAAKLGAIFAPMNFRLAAPEVTFLLADSGADVFVWSHECSNLARDALAGDGVRVHTRVVVDGDPVEGELDFEELMASGTPTAPGDRCRRSRCLRLMYTSGTTGRPKGVMLTHDNLMWNIDESISALDADSGKATRPSRLTPMFHSGGLGVHTLPLIYIGGTSTIMAAFDRPGHTGRDGTRDASRCSSSCRQCGPR